MDLGVTMFNEIILTEVYPGGTIKRTGAEEYILTEYDRIQIRIKSQDEEPVDCFDQIVPEGKQWNLSIGIFVKETDI